jgi:hypothetical protein
VKGRFDSGPGHAGNIRSQPKEHAMIFNLVAAAATKALGTVNRLSIAYVTFKARRAGRI